MKIQLLSSNKLKTASWAVSPINNTCIINKVWYENCHKSTETLALQHLLLCIFNQFWKALMGCIIACVRSSQSLLYLYSVKVSRVMEAYLKNIVKWTSCNLLSLNYTLFKLRETYFSIQSPLKSASVVNNILPKLLKNLNVCILYVKNIWRFRKILLQSCGALSKLNWPIYPPLSANHSPQAFQTSEMLLRHVK